MKVMSSTKLVQTWQKGIMLAYFVHIHNADFVRSLPIITAVTKICRLLRPRYMAKIMVFMIT